VQRHRALAPHDDGHTELHAELIAAEVAHELAIARSALHKTARTPPGGSPPGELPRLQQPRFQAHVVETESLWTIWNGRLPDRKIRLEIQRWHIRRVRR
jgi:hypothetical protein